MTDLPSLFKDFEELPDWKNFLKENFDRRNGVYNYALTSEVEVNVDNAKINFPTKIIFSSGVVRNEKDIEKTEKFTSKNKSIAIHEKQRVTPFSFYDRSTKYTGEVFEIMSDLLDGQQILKAYFSKDLLSSSDDPLFSIDSTIKWPSYILLFRKEASTNDNDLIDFEEDLTNFGIHFTPDNDLQNFVIVIFPMPYIRIAENKISSFEGKECIRLILEYNTLGLFYTSKMDVNIVSTIKNNHGEVIHNGEKMIDFENSKYQVVQIVPESSGEISYFSTQITINGVKVAQDSGYYIRSIKLNIIPKLK
jgi:hypothetical protein